MRKELSSQESGKSTQSQSGSPQKKFSIGDSVVVDNNCGVVRYVGNVRYKKKLTKSIYIGIEFYRPVGNSNGTLEVGFDSTLKISCFKKTTLKKNYFKKNYFLYFLVGHFVFQMSGTIRCLRATMCGIEGLYRRCDELNSGGGIFT